MVGNCIYVFIYLLTCLFICLCTSFFWLLSLYRRPPKVSNGKKSLEHLVLYLNACHQPFIDIWDCGKEVKKRMSKVEWMDNSFRSDLWQYGGSKGQSKSLQESIELYNLETVALTKDERQNWKWLSWRCLDCSCEYCTKNG